MRNCGEVRGASGVRSQRWEGNTAGQRNSGVSWSSASGSDVTDVALPLAASRRAALRL